ncbi:MAG: NADP-dependent oxidoreductase [Deferribacterales bacterium]
MKAVIVDNFGEADVLKVSEIDKPAVGADEVLIKVYGAGVNPVDGKTRKGMGFVAEAVKDHMPWIPGLDAAGIVEEVGSAVTEFQAGDRVFARLEFLNKCGAYAEYTVAKESIVAKAPENIELLYASGLPVAGQTAWQAMFDVGNVKEGDRVLIHAAAGGVGHLAVQFAKMKGAYVVCTASSHNRSFLEELGADEVIDYKVRDFAESEPFDFILDNMGFEVGEKSLEVLKPEGMMVTVPTVTAERVIKAGEAKGLNVKGVKVGLSKEGLNKLADLVDGGFIRVFISAIYSMDQAVQAHKDIESGHTRGKIVLGIA